MRSDSTMQLLWSKLFSRRLTASKPFINDTLPIHLLTVVGRKRPRLTKDRLISLDSTPTQLPDDDSPSVSSFYTCLSDFEDACLNQFDSFNHRLEDDVADGYYISKRRLRSLAKELMESMQRHLISNSGDSPDLYLNLGLGWQERPDEIPVNEETLEEMYHLTGYWKNDQESSDNPVILLELMEMPWIFKKAAGFVHHTEVRAHDTYVALYPQIMGITYPTTSYWTRDGKILPRRDLRKGKARIAMVRTTFGFRQFVQWGPPYAGFSVGEGQLSADRNTFEIVTCTQRYDGPQCCLRYGTVDEARTGPVLVVLFFGGRAENKAQTMEW